MRMRPSLVRGSIARTNLESKIAMYPRIVLDPLYMEGFGELGSLCTTEDSVCFINPFRLAFCEHLRDATSTPPEELKKAGLPQQKGVYAQLSNELILSQVEILCENR
jgi:hypothetical protein